MSTFIRSAIVAIALLGSISTVSARTHHSDYNGRTPSSYDLNDSDDVKAFWESQQRNGS